MFMGLCLWVQVYVFNGKEVRFQVSCLSLQGRISGDSDAKYVYLQVLRIQSSPEKEDPERKLYTLKKRAQASPELSVINKKVV